MRRRFQKGCFVKEKDGRFYSLFYVDAEGGKTKLVKKFIGHSRDMSERAARRQHALTMEKVNHDRGSSAPILKGETFQDAVDKWRRQSRPT